MPWPTNAERVRLHVLCLDGIGSVVVEDPQGDCRVSSRLRLLKSARERSAIKREKWERQAFRMIKEAG